MKPSSKHTFSLTAVMFAALVCEPAPDAMAQGRPISLPPQASEVAQGIYDLGFARDANGKVVQGFAFVHYRKDFARPEKPGGPKPPKTSPCYALLSSGAKWKVLEDYVFDQGDQSKQSLLYAVDRVNNLDAAISVWEQAAGMDILGDGFVGEVFPAQVATLNNLNEVMFGYLAEPGVIAITYTWGIFGGPPARRELVEWDMVFEAGWGWWYEVGLPGVPVGGVFDFLNIATHEIGHAMGLDHPNDTCTQETMYAYADYWETTKRDLHTGDIAGIRKLYP
jgi:hypothetical protein